MHERIMWLEPSPVIMPVSPAIVLCLLFVSSVTSATMVALLKLHHCHAHHMFDVVHQRMQPHVSPLLSRLCQAVVPWSSTGATVGLLVAAVAFGQPRTAPPPLPHHHVGHRPKGSKVWTLAVLGCIL
jgi:hypothetical protein